MKPIQTQSNPTSIHEDEWQKLKQFTDARIALGRAGCSIPTKAMLDFQLAHAQAKDAVYQDLDTHLLSTKLEKLGLNSIVIQSQAADKATYLKRPDLGRQLNTESTQKLKQYRDKKPETYDVLIVIGDGLSAFAIEQNAVNLIASLKNEIELNGWKIAPIIISLGSRVALGDHVAEILNVKMLVMMIGERPGLSSPDSMGIYYTYNAKSGSSDAERNCISNIRPAGLSIQIATHRLINLMQNSQKLGYSGVNLKDDHEIPTITQSQIPKQLF